VSLKHVHNKTVYRIFIMEYRVTGKYGWVTITATNSIAKVEASIKGKSYRLETNDTEYAFNLFSRFVGSIGADLVPEVAEIEITKNGKVVIHLGSIFDNHIVLFRTILPSGVEEETYVPVVGVIKRRFIRLSQR